MTTKPEVLAMAREAGIDEYDNGLITTDQFAERFAALIAAAEREECAKVCKQIAGPGGLNVPGKEYFYYTDDGHGCASAIRARSTKYGTLPVYSKPCPPNCSRRWRMGPEIADYYAKIFLMWILGAVVAGALLACAFIYGLPWLWEIIKPFLHEATK